MIIRAGAQSGSRELEENTRGDRGFEENTRWPMSSNCMLDSSDSFTDLIFLSMWIMEKVDGPYILSLWTKENGDGFYNLSMWIEEKEDQSYILSPWIKEKGDGFYNLSLWTKKKKGLMKWRL